MRQALLLGFLDVAEQGAGGGDRARLVVDAERGQVVHAEELQQLAAAGVGIEQPRCAAAQAARFQHRLGPTLFVGDQGFRRLQAGEFGFQRVVVVDFVRPQAAAGEIRPGQSVAVLETADRQQQRVAAFVEQGFVGDRARGDDTHYLAFDQTLGQCRVADLFADRHRLAQRHQPRQVALVGVVGHAGHRDRLAGGTAALGQGDVEQARGLARVVVEQFVEIAHPEEQQDVRVLRLGGEELAHQRRVLLEGHAQAWARGRIVCPIHPAHPSFRL